MKKIVSLALSTAMAFSMFASVTSAATMSTQEKYDALVAQKIFEGYPDGAANLNKDVTRAEFAKVVALMTGLDVTDTKTVTYSDPNYNTKYAWYRPYTEAVTKAGYMKGTTTGAKKLFNPNGKVTVQEMAATLVRAGKLQVPTEGINNGASAWAKGEVQAAINAGLISNTANFNAAATRSLLVDTAYAYQTKVVKPAVTSYEVQDNGATVVFTLANGEKVTVKPEKALVANTATTVNFKYGEYEYSESVTWKVTDATKVVSAAANNLKEVTVTFDGKVDPVSAADVNNYALSGRTSTTTGTNYGIFDSATVSADGTTVTLLLNDDDTVNTTDNTLVNNRQATLSVRNVKQATGTTTITQTVNFTPSDVTVPTIKEVKSLGTQALQVTFSEPVKRSTVVPSNFTIDGRAVAANVEYSYPNSVILTTPLTEGAHTLRVSGVQDYAGLSVVAVENSFTTTADTTAPKVVSTTSYDLREVRVTFDEPIKNVSSVTANQGTLTASSVERRGNMVVIKFPNNLNYASNTISLNGVTDYSNNSANLSTTVTPTLDLVAPTVVSSNFFSLNGSYYVDIQFSKAVRSSDTGAATDRQYYTLKDSTGKVVTGGGLTNDGHPIQNPVLNPENRTGDRVVRVNLGTSLNTSTTYTFEVSGVRDNTVAGNVLLPYTTTLNTAQAATGKTTRSWVNGRYVFVEFNKQIATTGTGNAIDASKYRLTNAVGGTTVLTDRNSDVEAVGASTVRIYARNFTNTALLVNNSIEASYVGDVNGNYFINDVNGNTNTSGRVVAVQTIKESENAANVQTAVYATSTSSIAVTFPTSVSGLAASDFVFTATGVTGISPSKINMSNDGRTATLDFNSRIPADFENGRLTLNANNGRDQFNNEVKLNTNGYVTVYNSIKPSVVTADVYAGRTAATNDITVTLPTTRDVQLNGVTNTTPAVLNLFTGRVATATDSVDLQVVSVTPNAAGSELAVVLRAANSAVVPAGTLYLTFDGAANDRTDLIVSRNNAATGDDAEALDGFSITPSLGR